MRTIRIVLLVSLCLLALGNVIQFLTRTEDIRVVSAMENDAAHPSAQIREELEEATAAAHRRFIREETGVGIILLCLSAGVAYTTGEIQKRASR